MNKKFLSAVLFGSLFAASTGTFVSCKDYDDDISGLSEDINGLEDRVAAVEKLVNELQTKIQNGAVITDVKSNADGIVVTLSDGKSYTITNGKNGADGKPGAQGAQGEKGDKTIVEIGENGNWFIDGVDTGKPSRGEKGETGETGKPGEDGKPGEAGKPGEGAAAATSIYYRPGVEGAEKGKWVEVTVNAKGEKKETVTEMSWMPAGCENNLTAVWADDELTFTGVEGVEDGKLTVALKNVLKAMVFQPDFVMDGERAMEYLYFPYKEHHVSEGLSGALKVHDIVSDSNSDNHQTVVKTIGYIVDRSTYADRDWSFLNPAEIKKYHMDPATAIIPSWWAENQEFEVASDDLDFINKRTAASKPVAAYFKKVEDGIMKVNVQMQGQKVMNQARTLDGEPGTDYWAPIKNNTQKITQLAIQAPIKEDKSEMITSTYAAVYASQVGMEAIVYEKGNQNIINTQEYGDEDLVGAVDHKDPAGDGYHLYATVKEAAEHAATVELLYNSLEGVNLNKLVSTHVVANSERSWNDQKFFDMNDEELAKYDMEFQFEQVGFAVGGSGTEETQNHSLLQQREDGMYIVACGVDSQSDTDASKVQPDHNKLASSLASVGRTPLIMVKVVNVNNKEIIKVGYIKFKIVAPEVPQVTEDFVLGNYYYGCDDVTKIITWHAIEEKLLDVAEIHHGQAGTSKATFDALYEVVKGEDGSVIQFVEAGLDKNNQKKFNKVTPVGVIKELSVPGAETTDVFSWNMDRADFVTMYNANKKSYPEITLKRFVKYVAKGNLGNTGFNKKPIYLPINVTFCYPMGIMNNKIAKYWYANNSLTPAQTSSDKMEAIHMGVEVPEVITEETVAHNNFYTDLDSRFQNNGMGGHTYDLQPAWDHLYQWTENAPSAKFDTDAFTKPYAWNVLANFADFAQDKLTYYYYFTRNNDGKKVKGASGETYTLSVDFTDPISPVALYAANSKTEVMNTKLYANGKIVANFALYNIVENPEMGGEHAYKIIYTDTPEAKDILNLPEGRKNLTDAQVVEFLTQTLDVEIGVAAFNQCSEYYPLKDNTFNAEILKPVYEVPAKDIEFWDARDGHEDGTFVNLADLFNFYDWRERDFKPSHLNYYHYYGINDIHVDVRLIETDITGERKALDATSNDVEFHVVRNGITYDREEVPAAGRLPYNPSWEDIVNHFGKLTYTYNNSTVGDFNIWVPVRVMHDWSNGERVYWFKGKVHHSEKN